ncbi:MAG: CidA/LrgA family protein [Christensenellaceae bacterium]|jgi:holin-like protein|nr:CidA/LrgA family protein [Christensenellaceae bacterium]
MKWALQAAIILGFSLAGEFLRLLLPLPVPAGVYGLLLMLGALSLGLLKLPQIEQTGEFLVSILPLLFVPAAAGLLDAWGVLRAMWPAALLAVLGLTPLVMGITGWVAQRLMKSGEGEGGDD